MEEKTTQAGRPEGQLFYDAFKASPIGIALEDLEGRPLFVNPALCSMLGFSEEEMRNKHCAELSPPEDAEKDWALFQQLRAGSIDHYHLDKRFLRRDGSLIWGRLSISLLNHRPSPLVIAMVEDITEKRTAQETLDLATRQIAAAVTRCSRDFRCLWANQRLADLLQRPLDEIVGRPILDVVGTEAFETLRPYFERVLTGERVSYEEEVNYRSIGKRWISATYTPTLDANASVSGWVGVLVDITERKLAEAALRESEERFRLIANTAPVMIWMSGVDKLCTYFNQRWLEFTGRSLEAELGNGWAEGVHSEDLRRCLETYTQAFDRREPFRMEYRLRRHDGEYRWIIDHGVPRFNADGSFAGYTGSAIDVTERKLTESALRKSDERLRLAMESGKSVGWDRDVKTGRDSLFGDLPSVFGIPSEVYDGHVEDFHRYVHPEDRGRVLEAIDSAMQTHNPYGAEFRLRWPDGTVRWLAAKGKFYYSRDGEAERMLGVATDITERKLAEAALRESEERFRLAAQAGRMYAFDWDVVTDEIIRSEESIHIFGLTGEPTRLTKRELLARVHPEDRARFMNSLECTPERPNTQISYRLLRPDSSALWLERTGHAFFDEQGKMVRMIGMVADITERKLAEDRLQEYKRAVEAAEEMIVVFDREYRYLIANNKFLKMRKMTKDQVVGRFVHEVLNKEMFQFVREKLDKCFQGEVVRYEMKNRFPELGERDIFVSYFPIEGAAGVDRVACILQDITERKRAEEALSAVSQRLIEAQEQERSRLARELHDDINQQLALLGVNLEGLRQSPPASAGELREQIAKVSEQIEDVGKDIQALSHRLHSPKLEYLGLAAAAASFCREFSDQQKVEIAFHCESVPKKLQQEISVCLFRVLQEALQNATKHSGSRQFEVTLQGGSNEIELSVHDSGVGFEPEEAIKGRGLGLTSMRERLKLVDGHLSIDSKPQHGTTIHARVPLNPGAKSAGAVGWR
jgi:PAS domain S-box-containing protein